MSFKYQTVDERERERILSENEKEGRG